MHCFLYQWLVKFFIEEWISFLIEINKFVNEIQWNREIKCFLAYIYEIRILKNTYINKINATYDNYFCRLISHTRLMARCKLAQTQLINLSLLHAQCVCVSFFSSELQLTRRKHAYGYSAIAFRDDRFLRRGRFIERQC